MIKRNPYKIVSYGNRLYGVEYKDYPHVGFPESWGTYKHAVEYMSNLLGLTLNSIGGILNEFSYNAALAA